MVSKEIRYLRRDPAFKFFVMQLVYMLAVVAIAIVYPHAHGRPSMLHTSPAVLWGWLSVLVMMEAHLVFNTFGIDAGAASVLFLFPGSRRQILLGKNLVLFGALTAANLVLAVGLAAIVGQLPQVLPLALWMALAMVIFISAGNLVSVWQPYPMVVRGWAVPRRSTSRGLGYGLVHMAALAVTSILTLPVLFALLVPVFWAGTLWLAVTVPLAIAYTAFAYLFTLHIAEEHLLAREIEVVEKLRPAD